ncbi:amidohydrolase family protein [Rhizosphaericola mali]|uniref:Amidohydrolase family protein n=1 Tax=Rhizosphaericola mali TaxID=2545455 RepID=A0A5P2G210_9BACT|nr:amidohydrolase family protein [Rhizosphaericola mali]QES88129.1 amidohydrolase family protein [Rhizosphaericola mali]
MKHLPFFVSIFLSASQLVHAQDNVILKHATIIDGKGGVEKNADILIEGKKIIKIGTNLTAAGVKEIDLKGKTIMPSLISDHVHIGNVEGTESNAKFYTRDHILYQLEKYTNYGVNNIMVMGTDRPFLFDSGIRDSSAAGLLPGARIHTAAIGFGAVNGAPPLPMAMDQVFRPTAIDQIPRELDSIKAYKPELVKMWLDDFNGTYKIKMKPEIYKAIIAEAHKRNLRVAAHVYYLSDAHRLVQDGVDILGHSIRDSIIDDQLIQEMKQKGVIYIPTLSLDEFAFIYAKKTEWQNDPFFKASLEPGVYELITSQAYQDKIKNDPLFNTKVKALEIAMKNLKKLYDAGILIALGTDSGAMFVRAQGFSEHLELQLMTEAGLTPMEAIEVATGNAAKAIHIDQDFGTIEAGKVADLLILNANPLDNIKNTRKIYQVWKDGKKVSDGPIKK